MTQRTGPHLTDDPAVLERYLRDESSFDGHAAGVVRVQSAEEVAEVLRAAHAARTSVTFSARRTSVTGAAIPRGGWVVGLPETSSPEMVVVDVAARTATAPAHVLVSDVEAAAEAAGLFFPVDPTSRKECSLGGAVACNASGARSFAHGPVGAWVRGLRVVLADGQIVELKRGEHPPLAGEFVLQTATGPLRVPAPPERPTGVKSSLGYATFPEPDLIDLFVGSEGTVGYIDQVTVELLPGAEVFAALVFWDDLGKALDFVQRLQSDPPPGLDPMSVEWFDARSLALAGARYPRFQVPEGAPAALFVEQRHTAAQAEAVLVAWYEALLEAGAPDDDAYLRIPRSAADHDAFRDFRHAVPESVNDLSRQRGLRKLGTDLAYPAGSLHAMYAHYEAAVRDLPAALGAEATAAFEAEHGAPLPTQLDTATFGHIGDNHLHVNLLPRDATEAAAGRALYRQLALDCAAAGGVICGEHGVGKSKRALLAEVLPPEHLARMRAVKQALDPHGILAPGNIL
jgi:D-lactate dehydrogenase (cytochrome)